MNAQALVKKSKWLSKHLRHAPQEIGLTLEPGGWVKVDDLLEAARRANLALAREQLETIVRDNDKKRFAFDETGQKIRANQGHSTEVDLQLQPQAPPPVLYHGTGAQNRESILQHGLVRKQRHHVHLSSDTETAVRVGARHGKPMIFEVDTARMQAEGVLFFRSQNGVWLTEEVLPQYLKEK